MARLISEKEVSDFHRDGYVIVPGFFSQAEIDKLYGIAVGDNVMREHAVDLNDQTGKKTRLTLWFNPGAPGGSGEGGLSDSLKAVAQDG